MLDEDNKRPHSEIVEVFDYMKLSTQTQMPRIMYTDLKIAWLIGLYLANYTDTPTQYTYQ